MKKFWPLALLAALFGLAAKRVYDADHPEKRRDLDRFDKKPTS